MTDDEIPCTVFRMDTLDWNSSVKYIKARSVIVKDAWTKKNLFIVSLNQHIRYICQASSFVNIGLGLQTQIWQLNCGKSKFKSFTRSFRSMTLRHLNHEFHILVI